MKQLSRISEFFASHLYGQITECEGWGICAGKLGQKRISVLSGLTSAAQGLNHARLTNNDNIVLHGEGNYAAGSHFDNSNFE